MTNKILLNPGPTNTSVNTKIEQWKGTDQCHRELDFLTRLNGIQGALKDHVFPRGQGQVAIMAGSGTTALQSMITSLLPNGATIIKAGSYGQRAIDIAITYKIDHSIIHSRTISDLVEDSSIEYVYFVENETSTAEQYNLKEMCEIYPNAKFFIDATSAFGASEYLPYFDRIVALSFCGNKCLQSTPGLGIVVWDGQQEVEKRSFFEDLSKYGLNKLPFTLPTQSVYALQEAISHSLSNKKLFDDRRNKLIRDFKKIGIECINENPSNSVIGFVHPTRDYDSLFRFLENKNIIIYSGIFDKKNSFRISTMSYIFDEFYDKIIGSFYDSCLS